MPEAVTALIRLLGDDREDNRRTKGGGRPIELTGPEFHRSAAEKYLCVNPRIPDEMAPGEFPEQGLGPGHRGPGRIQVADVAGYGQPDLRSGQPSRNLVGGGKTLEDAFRCGERRTVMDAVNAGHLERGLYEQGMRLGPRRLGGHALEPLGE